MIGKTVSHYKIIEKLGSGGMGDVYKAEDTRLKRTVALKFLSPELTRNEEAKRRFVHEAQASSALEHINICTIHEIDETGEDFGDLSGHMYIVMACYQGETLEKKIDRGALAIEEAADIAAQIASGLTKAHENGVIHRDIKPANIFITTDGVVKILDFGIAKLSGRTLLTREGTTLGTVNYISPEQARGENADQRSDIWSLGVVLYEMVSGRLPFRGDYDQAVIYGIINEEPAPFAAGDKKIPMALEEIIFKALSKNPEERYHFADELKSDLQQIGRESAKLTTKRHKTVPVSGIRKLLISPYLWTATIIVCVILILLVLFYPSRGITFSERDWLLITDFENHTDDQIFNSALNTALSVSIAQSSFINVFPKNRINETLHRMKKTGVDLVDENLGREIAVREGINVMVVPSISQVGNEYALSALIQNSQKGETYYSEIVRARDKDHILNSVDELSRKIRSDLGESLEAISLHSRPLSEVTTSSLEALKQYSLGIDYHWKGNISEARTCYENALKIDSGFTAAKASLGMLIFEKFYSEQDEGKKLITEAVKKVDNLTEKEKYGILAFHANAVENNMEKAVDYLKILVALYPDYYPAHNNLGWFYTKMNRFHEAVSEYRRALQIDPYPVFTYCGLNWLYLNKLASMDSAFKWIRRQIRYNPENSWGYDYLGWAYLGIDSLDQAQEAFKKSLSLNPDFILDLYRLAHVYRLQGQYREAIPLLSKIIQLDSTEASAYYDTGVNYQLMGETASARHFFQKFRKITENWIRNSPGYGANYLMKGIVLTRLDQFEQGLKTGQKGFTLDSTLHFEYAQLLALQGRTAEALTQLDIAIENGYHTFIWIKIHPDFQPLYDNPRFQELVDKSAATARLQ